MPNNWTNKRLFIPLFTATLKLLTLLFLWGHNPNIAKGSKHLYTDQWLMVRSYFGIAIKHPSRTTANCVWHGVVIRLLYWYQIEVSRHFFQSQITSGHFWSLGRVVGSTHHDWTFSSEFSDQGILLWTESLRACICFFTLTNTYPLKKLVSLSF